MTDFEGCFETETYEIQEPDLLTASVETVDVDSDVYRDIFNGGLCFR